MRTHTLCILPLMALLSACTPSPERQTSRSHTSASASTPPVLPKPVMGSATGQRAPRRIAQSSGALPPFVSRVPVPSDLRLFFFDGCWSGRGKTVTEAYLNCRRLGRQGKSWERRGCKCREKQLITLRKSDPVAFYFMSGDVWVVAYTVAALRKKCVRAMVRSRRQGVVMNVNCLTYPVRKAYGPYSRARSVSAFDDPKTYRYLDIVEGYWMDGKGEQPCFPAGTPIAVPGGEVVIEKLKPGDRVLSWDVTRKRAVTVQVTELRPKRRTALVELLLSGGTRLRTTRNHPFYLAGGRTWRSAGLLTAGQRLLQRTPTTLRPVRILSTSPHPATQVFTLSVTAPHTYFAKGILVHNY